METNRLTFSQKIEFGFNIINHMLIWFVAIYMSYVCIENKLQATALHAWLCTLGFNLLMAEGIMTFFSGNFVTYTMEQKSKNMTHWVLQVLGGFLGLAGGFVKIISKNGYHFTTTHGILGLVTMILTSISLFSGLSTLYSLRLKRFLSPLINKTIHNAIGLFAFLFGMLSVYYGYDTGFFKRKVEPNFVDMMRGFTILTIILSNWGPLKSLVNKFRSF